MRETVFILDKMIRWGHGGRFHRTAKQRILLSNIKVYQPKCIHFVWRVWLVTNEICYANFSFNLGADEYEGLWKGRYNCFVECAYFLQDIPTTNLWKFQLGASLRNSEVFTNEQNTRKKCFYWNERNNFWANFTARDDFSIIIRYQ